MKRYVLPLVWVAAFLVTACSALVPNLLQPRNGNDLGVAGGGTVNAEIRLGTGFRTEAAAKTTADVANYVFELRRQSDNVVVASFATTAPTARFVQVPDDTYYLRADAQDAGTVSIVEGGPQNSSNT